MYSYDKSTYIGVQSISRIFSPCETLYSLSNAPFPHPSLRIGITFDLLEYSPLSGSYFVHFFNRHPVNISWNGLLVSKIILFCLCFNTWSGFLVWWCLLSFQRIKWDVKLRSTGDYFMGKSNSYRNLTLFQGRLHMFQYQEVYTWPLTNALVYYTILYRGREHPWGFGTHERPGTNLPQIPRDNLSFWRV